MRRLWLPTDPSRRLLTIAVVCSLLLHLLLGAVAYMAGRWAPPVIAKRGEPLFIDIAPDKPEERAPLGNPSRPPGPDRPVPEPPRRSAQPPAARPPASSRPVPPAPAPRAVEPPKAPTPPQVATAPRLPAPESPSAPAPASRTPEREVSPTPPKPAAPESPPAPGRPGEVQDPRFALSRPSLDTPPGIFRQPGGGGGLHGGGRGGVEGEPIPLDTPDPRYQDYFTQVRQRIQANWIYPREAGERGIGGQLLIEFHIEKDGRLSLVDLVRSSGVEVLDDYAMRAIRLAQPFPPVPDSVAKRVLPVSGRFTYQIVGESFVNQFLR